MSHDPGNEDRRELVVDTLDVFCLYETLTPEVTRHLTMRDLEERVAWQRGHSERCDRWRIENGLAPLRMKPPDAPRLDRMRRLYALLDQVGREVDER